MRRGRVVSVDMARAGRMAGAILKGAAPAPLAPCLHRAGEYESGK